VLRTGNKKAAAALTLILDGLQGRCRRASDRARNGGEDASATGRVRRLSRPPVSGVVLRFRGGKGVATFIGITLGLYFPGGLAVCAVWLAGAAISRISSVGALAASTAAPLIFVLLDRWESVLLLLVLAVMLWLAHARNIRRLLRGEEPRIGATRQ
jgi:glycerol-3-phosphate acyltransferase PlsY